MSNEQTQHEIDLEAQGFADWLQTASQERVNQALASLTQRIKEHVREELKRPKEDQPESVSVPVSALNQLGVTKSG